MPNCIPNILDKNCSISNLIFDLEIDGGVIIRMGRFKSLNIFFLLNFLDEQCPLRDPFP